MMFAEELLAAYPDAKVILTNRDPDRWWKSFTESIGVVVSSTRYRLAAFLDPQSLGKFAELSQLIRSVILGPGATEEEAKRRFTAHYGNVRKIVPKDKLLEFEVKEGWGPLCAFWERISPRWTSQIQTTRRCSSLSLTGPSPRFTVGLRCGLSCRPSFSQVYFLRFMPEVPGPSSND
ncbi:hypothetical protein K438DRAFT_2056635 [Mycena galopus ATCC 62051]|nr:hypothetical protein K438DRAFT_2056635 [Mycena galopus ATCC 62051]